MIAREMHAGSMKNMQLESMYLNFCSVFAGVSFYSSKGGNSYCSYQKDLPSCAGGAGQCLPSISSAKLVSPMS